MVVLLSPPGHDDRFVVDGLVNPALHVREDLRLTVSVVNEDPTDTHSWAISNAGPPYNALPMMGSGRGLPLWGSTMLGEASGNQFWSQNLSFTLPVGGTSWYFCLHYGYAADGMYGSVVVSS